MREVAYPQAPLLRMPNNKMQFTKNSGDSRTFGQKSICESALGPLVYPKKGLSLGFVLWENLDSMHRSKINRLTNVGIGLGMTALGILGAFLPVLPSTCFFIFAAYFFGKSSNRLESWILNHPRFGHAVRSWRETRSIPMAGKVAASLGMGLSFIFIFLSPAGLPVKTCSALVLVGSALYIWTRPTLKQPGFAQQSVKN
jgi:uncharacterized membrane protein YbaN (DUF454 family)